MADYLRDQLESTLGGTYSLERELAGGMSRVFVAEEIALGRRVVVKVLPPDMAAAVNFGRFKREIALAARLQHPHIVPLLTAGEIHGVPYFTMPYVEGESLRDRLTRHGELPVSEAVRLLREVASALAYAHDHGVVHRDIKPDNILLSGGSAMVTDFGVAKALSVAASGEDASDPSTMVTSLGVALGTPAYMAPEQAVAEPNVDHRADVYAFGVVAYEVLTGDTPFAGRSMQAQLAAHVTETPEPVTRRRQSLPAPLAALVMSCLEKRAADRPQSAVDIVHALDAITTPTAGTTPTPASRRRVPWLLGAGVAIVAAIVGARAIRDRSTAAAAADTARSIAVLPFENEGGDTATAWFADGIADELTTRLGSLPGLRVASYRSAATFRGKQYDIRQAARALNVGDVLEGTVRRAGNTMRLNVRLTDATSGFVVWSNSYDRELKDALAVQSEVATAIASALRLRIAYGSARSAGSVERSVNPEAYDLYLRTLSMSVGTPAQQLAFRAMLRKAVSLDSTFAPAWGRLAAAEAWAPLYGFTGDSFAVLSRQHALHALAIDPASAQAYDALGSLAWTQFQFDDAIAMERRALALDPNYATAAIAMGMTWSAKGEPDSAIASLDRAAKLDPLRASTWTNVAAVHVMAGREDDAVRTQRRSLAMTRSAAGLGNLVLAFLAGGHADSARKYADQLIVDGTEIPTVRGTHVMALVASGANAQAEREANAIVHDFNAGRTSAADAAIALAWTGRGDSAMAIVEDGVRRRDGAFMQMSMTCGPELAPLREHPRMRAVAKQLDATICGWKLPGYFPGAERR